MEPFDLVVVDEAHRMSGSLGKAWADVHRHPHAAESDSSRGTCRAGAHDRVAGPLAGAAGSGEWDPHDLEVHPASLATTVSGPGQSAGRMLPGYVRREHDQALAALVEQAASGRIGAVVLVGGSSTGKTRACSPASPLGRD